MNTITIAQIVCNVVNQAIEGPIKEAVLSEFRSRMDEMVEAHMLEIGAKVDEELMKIGDTQLLRDACMMEPIINIQKIESKTKP